MKIRVNCLLYLPTTILLFSLYDSKPFAAAAASGGNNNNGRRKKSQESSSSSILEIMNTQEIEHLIAQQRNNNNTLARSGNQHNPLTLQNDLDEDLEFLETSQQQPSLLNHQHHHLENSGNKFDRYKAQNRRQKPRNQQLNRDLVNSDYGYSGATSSSHYQHQQRRRFRDEQSLTASLPASMELLTVPYNDSFYSDPKAFSEHSTLVDPRDMRGDKMLKSSKNALYITRKEYLKKDWCKTEPLVQRIREPGCLTRTFVNRFCYGQCNSFYIPKSPKKRRNNSGGHGPGVKSGKNAVNRYLPSDHFDDEDLTGAAFQSCGFCKPKKYTWITLTLRCPSLIPQLRKKRVQRIKQCRCMAEPIE